MSQVSFRCHYCYRVHSADRAAVGFVRTCSCGALYRVPDVGTDESSPAEDLPLAEKVTTREDLEAADGGASVAPPAPPSAEAPSDEASALEDEDALRPLTPPVIPRPDPEDDKVRGEDAEEELAELTAPIPPADPEVAEEWQDFPALEALEPAEPVLAASPVLAPEEVPSASELAPVPLAGDHADRSALPDDFDPPSAEEGLVRPPKSAGRNTERTRTMGRGYLIAALLVFLVWLVHTSPWIYFGLGSEPLPEQLRIVPHTHYLSLERAFWSAILFGLALALLGEGWIRRRRALATAPAHEADERL